MSDMRPEGVKIKLGDKEYRLLFTLNAIDDIQEHFDMPISELGKVFSDEKTQIRNLRYLLTLLINEDIDCQNDFNGTDTPHLEERYVGRHIHDKNIHEMMTAVFNSFTGSIPEGEEDEIPNEVSE